VEKKLYEVSSRRSATVSKSMSLIGSEPCNPLKSYGTSPSDAFIEKMEDNMPRNK